MRTNRRRSVLLAGLATVILAACGTQNAPTPDASIQPPASAAPTAAASAASSSTQGAAPSIDRAAASAYSAAMCPIFDDILRFDPRLAALRQLGAEGGDVADSSDELNALTDELGATLDDLEAVPDWSEGAQLRFLLISALHAIRAHLVHIAEEPGAAGAADSLAETPFIASEEMDRAMSEVVVAGLVCETAS